MTRRSAPWLLWIALLLAPAAQAQLVDDFAFGFSPRTGDAWMDARLGDINVYASSDRDGFINDVVVSYGAPRYYVRELYLERRWAPGDIYYACALAHQLGLPCRDVAERYQQDHGQGWGVIAKRLGIKPGSEAFHALKGKVGRGHGAMKGRHGGAPAARGQGKPERSPAAAPAAGPPGKDKDKGKGKGKGH